MKGFEGPKELPAISEEKKDLPIGSGEKILKEREKLTLPVENVKNTVVWVNPDFPEAPFKLQKGKPTELGVFFTLSSRKESKNLKISPEEREGRSGLLGSVIFRDKDGILYRDLDVKGIGHFKVSEETQHKKRKKYEVGETWILTPSKVAGIMNYGHALQDRNNSERFIKAGIRTHRVLAIAELKEIIDGSGQKISIAEARKKNLISEKVYPVIEIRAFGTKNRIENLDVPGMGRKFLEDAKAIVAQELGKDPKNFSTENYLKWFAKTLGEQIVKLKKFKYYQPTFRHNVTLDCRLVDLDSVDSMKNITKKRGESEQNLSKDMAGSAAAHLQTLVVLIGRLEGFEEFEGKKLIKICHSIYEKSYGKEVMPFKIIVLKEGPFTNKPVKLKYFWQILEKQK